ncbi:TPA: DUF2075 domain-containing protein [Enterococcus faecalis]|nr:DUF2075 domain-containing protein [Enterococcus faecalis]HDT7995385.1 DUF2075 domain-containing protein [Enterococcus faecalis]
MDIMNTTKDDQLINSMLRLCDDSIVHNPEQFFRKKELQNLYQFSEKLLPTLTNIPKADNYFIGYSVSIGITRQFDVLRFSTKKVVNIELKDCMPSDGLEAIRRQLIKNQLFLKVLGKEIISCTYIADTETIYMLTADDELSTIEVEKLGRLIPMDSLDINELESQQLTNFIISPYSETDRFVSHTYFLTDQQETKKNQIMQSNSKKIGIIGRAGTGKSILLFDLAQTWVKKGKKVLVVFVGQLDNYSSISEKFGFEITPIRFMNRQKILEGEYDIVLVDEAQRLSTEQYSFLTNIETKIILSVDHLQILHPSENDRNIEGEIEKNSNFEVVNLGNKVRTDKELADFINKLMNLSARNVSPHDYNNISINYFESSQVAKDFIDDKVIHDGWNSIEFTEYRTKYTGRLTKSMISNYSLSTHEVVGREYDKVIIVIDSLVRRSDDGKLIYMRNDRYPYLEMSLLLEGLTRVRSKLMLVVVNNADMYVDIQRNLLSWKNDQLAGIKTYDKELNYDSWDNAIENLEIPVNGIMYKASKVEYIEKTRKVKVSYWLRQELCVNGKNHSVG